MHVQIVYCKTNLTWRPNYSSHLGWRTTEKSRDSLDVNNMIVILSFTKIVLKYFRGHLRPCGGRRIHPPSLPLWRRAEQQRGSLGLRLRLRFGRDPLFQRLQGAGLTVGGGRLPLVQRAPRPLSHHVHPWSSPYAPGGGQQQPPEPGLSRDDLLFCPSGWDTDLLHPHTRLRPSQDQPFQNRQVLKNASPVISFLDKLTLC